MGAFPTGMQAHALEPLKAPVVFGERAWKGLSGAGRRQPGSVPQGTFTALLGRQACGPCRYPQPRGLMAAVPNSRRHVLFIEDHCPICGGRDPPGACRSELAIFRKVLRKACRRTGRSYPCRCPAVRLPGNERALNVAPSAPWYPRHIDVRKPRAPPPACEDTATELLDRRIYYRAFETRDARFDGRVFVGVTSTASTAGRSARRAHRSSRTAASSSRPPPPRMRFPPACAAGPRSHPTLPLARHGQHGEPGAGADHRGRSGRRRCRCRGAGRAAGRRRPPVAAAVPAPSGARPSLSPRRAVLFAKQLLRHARLMTSGFGLAFWQRALLQRDFPRPVRRPPSAPGARWRRQFGARWRDAAPGLSAALTGPACWQPWRTRARHRVARGACGTAHRADGSRQRRRRPSAATQFRPGDHSLPSVKALLATSHAYAACSTGADIVTIDSHLARDPKLTADGCPRPARSRNGNTRR